MRPQHLLTVLSSHMGRVSFRAVANLVILFTGNSNPVSLFHKDSSSKHMILLANKFTKIVVREGKLYYLSA